MSLAGVLEKMSAEDKDFRYMATSDLLAELEKESFRIDEDGERKICGQVLKRLKDSSGDIQGLAIKCLGVLSRKVQIAQVESIVVNLCIMLLQQNTGSTEEKKKEIEGERDIASIGLKTVVAEIHSNQAAMMVAKKMSPQLNTGIKQDQNLDVKQLCLEVMNDLLKKFGTKMTHDHENMQEALIPQLTHKKPTVRKRAIGCVSTLATSESDALFVKLMSILIDALQKQSSVDLLKTNVQTICAISRSAGYRVGKFLEKVLPLLLQFSSSDKFKDDDELKESCIQCFESFILRCPREITVALSDITTLCLSSIKYDPNYQDGSDNDDAMVDSDEDESDDDDDGEYSDDEDMSWKVRRAAAKCLAAIVLSRPELMNVMYERLCPVLISRFREREENVKHDIFATFNSLLKQTSVVAKSDSSCISLLSGEVTKIVKSLIKQLKEKSPKTRVGVFTILKELANVLPGGLAAHLASLVPGVAQVLSDKNSNSNLKIEVLVFLQRLIKNHEASAMHAHIKVLLPALYNGVNDKFYKVTAESLRVLALLTRAMRPLGSNSGSFDFKPHAQGTYDCVNKRLVSQDQDQEVKEAAIMCMGTILSHMGDALQNHVGQTLSVLVDRMRNEITRTTSVSAFTQIAQSPLKIDMGSLLTDVVSEFSGFLRKANRTLVEATLLGIVAFVGQYGAAISSQSYQQILVELAPLISDTDLHIAQVALDAVIAVVSSNGPTDVYQQHVHARVLALVQSPLLQGLALETVLRLFSVLVRMGNSGFNFGRLVNDLVSLIYNNVNNLDASSKQAFISVAHCVAACCTQPNDTKATVDEFMKELGSGDEKKRMLALYCIGQIGKLHDLSGHANLEDKILKCFDVTSENIRSGASFCLGSVTIGNLGHYLPTLLQHISSHQKYQYLLVHALKEVITGSKLSEIQHVHQQIVNLLTQFCNHDEEGVRNVVAECLGKLAAHNSSLVMPILEKGISDGNAFVRGTTMAAFKFCVLDASSDDALVSVLPKFFALLTDSDVIVRRAAMVALNSALHSKPRLVRDLIPTLLPNIYNECKPVEELLRKSNLGCFVHTVDEHLPVRKAAFETLDTMLDNCLDCLKDMSLFIAQIVDGLKDNYEIKLMCHMMLSKLCVLVGPAVLASLDQLTDPLDAILNTKLKDNAVKPEIDRHEELCRSTLRAVAAITRIPDADSCLKFTTFLENNVRTTFADKFEAIVNENSREYQGGDAMDLS